jgi:ABC-type arginine transport system permease subunit
MLIALVYLAITTVSIGLLMLLERRFSLGVKGIRF